ncbi:MAG TPA: type III pantothenate kinase, partial [Caldisericia bacterium]|nr:type III pantothenate kinase [Caldisericia bacterium]
MMSSGKLTLCIDCGNTNIKFGVFDSVSLVANFRVATDTIKTSDEYAIMLRTSYQESYIAFAQQSTHTWQLGKG